jgi:hypothetical protein
MSQIDFQRAARIAVEVANAVFGPLNLASRE